ncbi:MAG TPA: hypothetical protein VFG69_13580 [Nannocystaceae bacterium]|nr:hypothetical protein [Nannocystaceae bacterium]
MMRSLFALAVAALAVAGCKRTPEQARPAAHELRRDLELTDEQRAWLTELAADADAHPDDLSARKRSGLAHLRFTLEGVLSLRDRAELDLEAAFRLAPTDKDVTRSLGRFYNLRAVAGDYTKADLQVEVYRAHLGDTPVADMTSQQFVAYSFAQLGEILAAKNRGTVLTALRKIEALERVLAARVQAHPNDIEMRALAGNFEFFFAGNVPLSQRKRVENAVADFEVVRTRWAEIRVGARDPEECPNTYENFMFELAEGLLVLDRVAEAEAIYRELTTIVPPVTRAKELVAAVSAERLRNVEHYRGEMELMPPWPSDVANCVVCHSYTSEVSLQSLHVREPIRLADVPTAAVPKPIARP